MICLVCPIIAHISQLCNQ